MRFNSLSYLTFLPAIVGLYYLLPHKYRSYLLLGASCYFYAYFIPKYIWILLFVILVDYTAGILIEKNRAVPRQLLLIISLIANCGVLFVFKYFDFFSSAMDPIARSLDWNYSPNTLHFILPIGLSFHTFQAMSYTIEVYRGQQPAEKNIIAYSLYVLFFPQLVAGPIERPQNLLYQFHQKHDFNSRTFVAGLRLILWGIFKKVVVADRLAIYADEAFANSQIEPGIVLALATFLFTFQIYYDFSGYTDIARGSARLFGFELMENFKTPYFSQSISEFWRRWHISLSTWFRDYLYIPLGGNRQAQWLTIRNLFIVFILSGLWHGAALTFIAWGALHFTYLAMEIYVKKKDLRVPLPDFVRKCLNVSLTFSLVSFAWIFFRSSSIHQACNIIFEFFFIPKQLSLIYFKDANLRLSLFLIVLMCVLEYTWSRYSVIEKLATAPTTVKWTAYYILILTIFAIGVFNRSSFIYFQF
jgi:alginate O-acetyltransferase complex protein AlgI